MEQMAAIGKVINTHGVKGGLKIQILSDFPERIKQLKRVFVEKDGLSSEYGVVEAFIHGQFWVLYLKGITDLDAAARLNGSLLLIPKKERLKLPKDTFYLDEIIGLTVYTTAGAKLGKVADILQTGSNDVYVVRPIDSGQPDILIPALKSVVRSINADTGTIEVDLPEGLIEDAN